MLVYDNSDICIAAATRCGHTSMYDHLNLPRYSNELNIDSWIQSFSRKILVLRNPYDRIQSATKLPLTVFPHEFISKHVSATTNSNNSPKKTIDSIKEHWIRMHSSPYMIHISEHLEFEIIDFYNLHLYIKLSPYTSVTDSNSVDRNLYKDYPLIENEYEKYRYFMTNRKQISPIEWKQITQGINRI